MRNKVKRLQGVFIILTLLCAADVWAKANSGEPQSPGVYSHEVVLPTPEPVVELEIDNAASSIEPEKPRAWPEVKFLAMSYDVFKGVLEKYQVAGAPQFESLNSRNFLIAKNRVNQTLEDLISFGFQWPSYLYELKIYLGRFTATDVDDGKRKVQNLEGWSRNPIVGAREVYFTDDVSVKVMEHALILLLNMKLVSGSFTIYLNEFDDDNGAISKNDFIEARSKLETARNTIVSNGFFLPEKIEITLSWFNATVEDNSQIENIKIQCRSYSKLCSMDPRASEDEIERALMSYVTSN